MSFGYLIVCKSRALPLETSRRYNFRLILATGGYNCYFRFEEGPGLTNRNGSISSLTTAGITLLSTVDKSFYLMDCVLANGQSEIDVARAAQTTIKHGSSIETIELSTNYRLQLNKIYLVRA